MSSDLFLSDRQEQQVVRAIAEAENRTSAEIRVHIEHTCDRDDPLERAARIFHELGMDQTERQNGVLIYVASEDHKVAVYGGKGIHKQVEADFWSDVVTLMTGYFKDDEFEQGLEEAVKRVGSKLSELYPHRREDVNELTDEISYHGNPAEEE